MADMYQRDWVPYRHFTIVNGDRLPLPKDAREALWEWVIVVPFRRRKAPLLQRVRHPGLGERILGRAVTQDLKMFATTARELRRQFIETKISGCRTKDLRTAYYYQKRK